MIEEKFLATHDRPANVFEADCLIPLGGDVGEAGFEFFGRGFAGDGGEV